MNNTELKGRSIVSDYALRKMDDSSTYVPEHIRDSLLRYIVYGTKPGDFLSAVISNDLKLSVGKADHINSEHLNSIVRWIYNFAPADCWGYSGVIEDWNDILYKYDTK